MFKNWRTTVGGVAGFLVTWTPVFQDWLNKNPGHIGLFQVLGLVILTMGVVAKDGKVTGT